jgi:hypothetical protein
MTSRYDAFLSYNSADRASVEQIASELRNAGLSVFLDRWYLIPGESWVDTLERTIADARSMVVFVGPSGLGSWQQREMRLALDRQAQSPSFRVIPAILDRADPPTGFLALNTWVDIRSREDAALRLIDAIRGHESGSPKRVIASPYRSLKSFMEADAPFFFGRDEFVERLENAAVRHPFVVVAGPSGSGKSSAVRAGLFPRIRSRAGGRIWEIVDMRPGDHALESLVAAFYPLLNEATEYAARRVAINTLATEISKGTISLASMVRDVLARQPGTDRVLLFVDQWEELYTLVGADERDAFVGVLLDAVEQSPLTIVTTLPGDFYGEALRHRRFSDHTEFVPISGMNVSELRDVIEKPAAAVGAHLESGLAERLLEELEQTPDQLPLLEFVLAQLWDGRTANALTHETYDEIGRLAGAIATHAEREFRSLSPDEQAIARRTLLRLVVLGSDHRHMKRPGSFKELPHDSEPVVRKLATARLVVTDFDAATGQDRMEIVHEALLRQWKTLADWIEEDRRFLTWREGLRVDVQRWIDAGRDADMRLRGMPSQIARKWEQQRGEELDADEKEFIEVPRRIARRIAIEIAMGAIAIMFGVALMFRFGAPRSAQLTETEAFVSGVTGTDTSGLDEPNINSDGTVIAFPWSAPHNQMVSLERVVFPGGLLVRALSPPGSHVVLVNNKMLYGGEAFTPTLSDTFLTQVGTGNRAASFALTFVEPVDRFTFVRPKLHAATKSGVTFPQWSAHAYDVSGHEIASTSSALSGTHHDETEIATY